MPATSMGSGSSRPSAPWTDTRLIPIYIAAFSLLVLGIQTAFHLRSQPRPQPRVKTLFGARKIFLFQVGRALSTWALLGTLVAYVIEQGRVGGVASLALVISVGYAATLSTLPNLLNIAPVPLVDTLLPHATLVLLGVLGQYIYRDIWPLCTYTLSPKDATTPLFWTQIALCTFAGVVFPLLEPYPYVPFDGADPQNEVNPEQTAPLASHFFFSYVQHVIVSAHVNEGEKHPVLPPLADVDYTRNLVKASYPDIDPFSGATATSTATQNDGTKTKSVSLAWALLKVFRGTVIAQVVNTILDSILSYTTPIATYQLLQYLETNSEGAVVRPWVWIVLLGVGGSLLPTITAHYAYYLSDRSFARLRAIVTALVFDHALRIRPSADSADSETHSASESEPSDHHGHEGEVSESASTAISTSGAESDLDTIADEQQPLLKGKGDGKQEKQKPAALAGMLNDLVTSDLDNLQGGNEFVGTVIDGPVKFVLGIAFLYVVMGWSAFAGLAVMLVLFPVPAKVGSRMAGDQGAKMAAADRRVDGITETVSVLRMIKLFAFTAAVEKDLDERREKELGYVWNLKVLGVVNQIVAQTISLAHLLVTFACFTLIAKQPLTASIAFSVIRAFQIIQQQIGTMVYGLPGVIASYVSLGRLEKFLNTTELLDIYTVPTSAQRQSAVVRGHEEDVGCGHSTFTWSADATSTSIASRRFQLRIENDLVFKKGAVNLIVGPTGCGKTSLLLALLGELHHIPMDSKAWLSLPRTTGIAYAAQESWVLNDTIRNNIVFTSEWDEERYMKVLFQCGLEKDIGLFKAGDATEVGEKGLTLSGGQKARVTLARAIYSSAQIVLLDDVLAALDVHTARWIVEKCLQGDLLKGRTVVLVTHNLALASPIAQFVVALGNDGRIKSQGSLTAALQADATLAEELKVEQEAIKTDELEDAVKNEKTKDASSELQDQANDAEEEDEEGKLIMDEEIEIGRVSWDAWKIYYSAMGGNWPILFWIAAVGGDMLRMSTKVLQTYWIGLWAQQYLSHPADEVNVKYYLGVYTAIAASTMLFLAYADLMYATGSIRASLLVHRRLINSLLASTFRWLDTTPTSRIITRCTHDIGSVDGDIPQCTEWMIMISNMMIVYLAAVCIFSPIFILGGLLLCAGGATIGHFYVKAQVAVKREMSVSSAPVLAVFGSVMTGLVSVRAYGAEERFRSEFMRRQDHATSAQRVFGTLSKWIGTRSQTLGGIFVCALAVYLVYGSKPATPSEVGFSLSMATGFSSQILFLVTTFNELEVAAISLERIKHYLFAEKEAPPTERGEAPAYWPASGTLSVEKLSARYSQGGQQVLHDVSFTVNAGERVGIVGRTGSGKSTLTLALLRAIPTEGRIVFDGRDIGNLNLDTVRRNVTIIPQMPELLSGTLRRNLDMFGEHDDQVLNDALRSVGLIRAVGEDGGTKLGLDSEITSGGSNLSVGQRQLVAMARALIRGSKLLVLDEATSAIDHDTDTLIQKSLRKEVAPDVSVIIVAHRLATVMDCDKIMVLDAGRLIEFDTPLSLLGKENSFFKHLVDQSADKKALIESARRE